MSESCAIPQEYIEQQVGRYMIHADNDGHAHGLLHRLFQDAYVKGFESAVGQVKEICDQVEENDVEPPTGSVYEPCWKCGYHHVRGSKCCVFGTQAAQSHEDAFGGKFEAAGSIVLDGLAASIMHIAANQPEEIPYPKELEADHPTCQVCGSNHWSNEACVKPKKKMDHGTECNCCRCTQDRK